MSINQSKIPVVTSSKIFEDKKFHPEGIFSEQLFGPIRDYVCQCGHVRRPDPKPTLWEYPECPKCKVKFAPSYFREKVFGQIIFPQELQIISPRVLYYVFKLNKTLEQSFRNKEKHTLKELNEFIKSIMKNPNTQTKEEFVNYINKNKSVLRKKNLLVIPPAFRPMTGKRKNYVSDKLNHYYEMILAQLESYQKSKETGDPQYEYTSLVIMNFLYDCYKETCVEEFGGKEGRFRQNILGKRNDFTGRSVVVVDPSLDIDTIKVPYKILKRIYEPYIVHYYKDVPYKLEEELDDSIEMSNDLKQVINLVAKDIPVLMNRQPTLHRPSIRAFKVIPTDDLCISVPPFACALYNMDFDGDQAAIYAPVTKEETEEFKNKLQNHKNQLSPGTLDFMSISQYGYCAYLMTKDEPNPDKVEAIINLSRNIFIELKNLILNKNLDFGSTIELRINSEKRIDTVGRTIIYLLFQKEVKKPLNKKSLDKIITEFIHKVVMNNENDDDIRIALNILIDFMSMLDYTIDLKHIVDILKDERIQKLKKKLRVTKNQKILKSLEDEFMKIIKEFELWKFIETGSKGKPSQITSQIFRKGIVESITGRKINHFIKRSVVDGLTPKDFYYAAYGTRKGTLDRSISTADTGYFTRKLVFATNDVEFDEDLLDCKTTKVLSVELDENIAEGYLYRYIYDVVKKEYVLLTKDNLHKYIGKKVLMRSPIFCKSKKLCRKCVGEITRFLNTPYIGLVAAQALGERCTQLIMRTFHTGGVAENAFSYDEEYFKIEKNMLVTTKPIIIETISKALKENDVTEEVIELETEDGYEFIIPEDSQILINLEPKKEIPEKTVVCMLPKEKELTNLMKYVLKALETPDPDASIGSLYDMFVESFWKTEKILPIYYEIIISQMRRVKGQKKKLWRLNQDKEVEVVSIKEIPQLRPLQAIGFQNFQRNLYKLCEKDFYSEDLSILEKILLGMPKSKII